MTETQKKIPSKEGQILLDTLQKAVTDTLEKKTPPGSIRCGLARWQSGDHQL
jgi:hypothetical protein